MDIARYLTTFETTGAGPQSSGYASAIKRKSKNYFIGDGNLFRRTKKGARYIPNIDDRPDLLTALHDDIGHWDFRASYKILADRYWWPSMRNDVAAHVRTCDECQKTKPYARYKSAQHQPVSGIFDTWSLDFAGPLPRTARGNRYLLVGVEHLTGWPVAAALPDALSTDA